MPAEGLQWLAKPEVLSFEELHRMVTVMARMGVREVRLTGGEPLVLCDLPDLRRRLATVPGVEDLSLTTMRSTASPVRWPSRAAAPQRLALLPVRTRALPRSPGATCSTASMEMLGNQ